MSGGRFSGRLEPKFNPFDDDYLADIISVTALAWTRMEHPGLQEIEDRITFRLAGFIQNDITFAEIPYVVVPQYWKVGPKGELLGREDLRFTYRHSQRDYFVFEAKRLRVTYPGGSFSTEYPTYAGKDGMMAFVAGQYGETAPAGGMIGYVMDGLTDPAWDGLGKRIKAPSGGIETRPEYRFHQIQPVPRHRQSPRRHAPGRNATYSG